MKKDHPLLALPCVCILSICIATLVVWSIPLFVVVLFMTSGIWFLILAGVWFSKRRYIWVLIAIVPGWLFLGTGIWSVSPNYFRMAQLPTFYLMITLLSSLVFLFSYKFIEFNQDSFIPIPHLVYEDKIPKYQQRYPDLVKSQQLYEDENKEPPREISRTYIDSHTPPKQSYRFEEKPRRRVSRTTTPSAEVAEIIERILQQKPEYTRNDILTKIQEIRNILGPESIIEESAVMIVAEELGVYLYKMSPRPTDIPRRDSKTYIDPNGYKRYSDSEEPPREISRTYIDHHGYKRYSDSDRLVHRHIAEIYVIRRKLREDEVVHHINGNKLDNRSSNLRVMAWREHKELHDR